MAQKLSDYDERVYDAQHMKMVRDADRQGYAEYTDTEYWPPAERFGKARITEARRTSDGLIETKITNTKYGEVIYESDWS